MCTTLTIATRARRARQTGRHEPLDLAAPGLRCRRSHTACPLTSFPFHIEHSLSHPVFLHPHERRTFPAGTGAGNNNRGKVRYEACETKTGCSRPGYSRYGCAAAAGISACRGAECVPHAPCFLEPSALQPSCTAPCNPPRKVRRHSLDFRATSLIKSRARPYTRPQSLAVAVARL